MTDMKKLLELVTEKTTLTEGVNVSINVSGDSAVDVGDVLQRVTNLSQPRPVTPDMMPKEPTPPPMPMIKALDIVGKLDHSAGPAVSPAPPGDEAPPPPPGDMEPPVAPEAIGQNIMQPDPSDAPTGGPSTSSQPGAADLDGGVGGGLGGGMPDMGGEEMEMVPLPDPEGMVDEAPGDLNSVLSKHRQAFMNWKNGGDIGDDDAFFQDLFDYYANSGEMPYGVQKARDGDPYNWIHDRLSQEVGGSMDEEQPTVPEKSKGLSMNSSYKEIHDRLREIDQALSKKHNEFKNMPDEKYSSTDYMTKDLAGGLNKPKTMSKDSYKQGDNPMAMEDIVMDEWKKFKISE